MKKIYTHENRLLVWDIKNALENIGFSCIIKNEFTSGGAGDLSPLDTWPEVWLVHDYLYEAATSYLREKYEAPAPTAEWVCRDCDEHNAGTFEICWNCGYSPL